MPLHMILLRRISRTSQPATRRYVDLVTVSCNERRSLRCYVRSYLTSNRSR